MNSQHNLINIDAESSELVTQDKANVTLKISAVGDSKSQVQQALKKQSHELFKLLKKNKDVESYTAGQKILDRWENSKDNKPVHRGYTGEFLIGLTSYNFESLNILLDEVTAQDAITLEVASIDMSISFKLRKEKENDLTRQAIKAYQEKAQLVAQAFDFSSYTLGEITVSNSQDNHLQRYMNFSASASSMASGRGHEDTLYFVEPRQERIQVSITGQIVLTRNVL